jgi:hypothetical protein
LLLGCTILTHEWWLVGALAGLAAVLATIAAWECCIAVAGALAALDHGVASTVSTSHKPPEFVQPRTRRFAAAGAENR